MDDAPRSPDGDQQVMTAFLDDLRRTGTVVTGPVTPGQDDGEPGVPPVEWLVSAHRGDPLDPPYRLRLDAGELAAALAHDAGLLQAGWPDGAEAARARDALLTSFDAALEGIDRTPHRFVLEDDTLDLTTNHPCPDPLVHLDPDSGDFFWSAHAPGDPEFEEQLARFERQSPHRRHAGLVRAWLVVEAAMDTARLDPAVQHLQDQVDTTFGPGAMMRFSEHVETHGFQEADLTDLAYADDERLDALLDALAGEPPRD
ncbi:hypothetical protein GCU67_10380 [Modestobacter muralis]|uniref:Uncharacterized protein n=1 Tax=Modestobacter muralis TaxID=1608614 RepID=A0A6P0H6X8_9ACTN|nr:hypothetical protein [Modestobacter muralis]NEK94572.1 hypothetical protein [Modestobacter muralis]NEN51460.1 hypothetical protein [Modestobacter muralis]